MNVTKLLPRRVIFIAGLSMAGLLYAAVMFSPAGQPLGYIAPLELSTTNLANGAHAYRAWFENGAWQGDLVEYDVAAGGAMTSSVDLSGTSPANTGTPPANWSAHEQFANAVAAPDYWNSSRKVITSIGGSQRAFRWGNLNATQKEALDAGAFNAGDASSSILDFIRGKRSNETQFGGNLRQRYSIFGDVIHSNPVYVGAPRESFFDSSYVTFFNSKLTRSPRVHVGANDGMLHVFDAATGNEVYAYIPSMLIGNLDKLAATSYRHTYFVDGELVAGDAFFAGAWHTVLVGGLGAGGKGLFALDITDPNLSSETSSFGTNKKILWELGAAADSDLGYTYGRPVIAKLNDGKWYAAMGNGYDSVSGVAVLYLVNLETGSVTKVSTSSGSSAAPNGLSSPALVDTDRDGKADLAYAGDLDGNMWRFDLTAAAPGSWAVAYGGTPLFQAGATQAITSAPDITTHPTTGRLIFFGTGRLLTAGDTNDVSIQSLYGIWDKGSAPGSVNLLTQTLSSDQAYSDGGFSETVRTLSDNTIDWAGASPHTGWKVEFPAGERLLTHPQLRNGRVIATISEPATKANWLLEASYLDGGPARGSIFDLNRDGVLNSNDSVDSSSIDPADVPMAWRRTNGIMSQPTIAVIAGGVDTLFLNYLVPTFAENQGCVGNCVGGIDSGHFDLDTDAPSGPGNGFANNTTKHKHEYDDSYDVTYADYFSLQGGQMNVQAAIADHNKEFITLVANADLSPGSELTVGQKRWNVVEYQAMLHKKLRGWTGSGSLLDDDGDSLIFTVNSILERDTSGIANGNTAGTIRNTFDSQAIRNGGLHPTKTGCVTSPNGLFLHNDRWRNGALIVQLVDKDQLVSQIGSGVALDVLTVQNPPDLVDPFILADGTQVFLSDDFGNNGTVGDQIASAQYEKFGGLRVTGSPTEASDPSEFLYESSLFWHFNGACYGDPAWQADKNEEVGGFLSDEEFLALTGKTVADTLNAFNLYAHCKDVKQGEVDSNTGIVGCEDDYKAWVDAIDELYKAASVKNANTRSGTPGEYFLPPLPIAMPGGASDQGVTPGPNFETGRRSWTDITPE